MTRTSLPQQNPNIKATAMNVSASEQQTIINLESELWAAVVSGDRGFLQSIFTEDYLEITADGLRVENQAIVSESPDVDKITLWKIYEPQVQRLSETAFLLSYRLELEGTCRDEPILPRKRWATSVWKKSEEAYQCSFFQQTPIQGG